MAWCAENSPAARLERTVFQGVCGLLAAWLASIAGAPEWLQTVIVPGFMLLMTELQAAAGGKYLEEPNGKHVKED